MVNLLFYTRSYRTYLTLGNHYNYKELKLNLSVLSSFDKLTNDLVSVFGRFLLCYYALTIRYNFEFYHGALTIDRSTLFWSCWIISMLIAHAFPLARYPTWV